MGTWATVKTAAKSGGGWGKGSYTTRLSYCFYVIFFLIQCLLACCEPLSVFQTFDKVVSNGFCLCFSVSMEGWVFGAATF